MFAYCYVKGRPVVIIGNNEVRGETVTLKTPLCVIKKKEKGEKMEDEPYSGLFHTTHSFIFIHSIHHHHLFTLSSSLLSLALTSLTLYYTHHQSSTSSSSSSHTHARRCLCIYNRVWNCWNCKQEIFIQE